MFDMSVQNLINTGMAWRLEGSVGRECMAAIESGKAILGPKPMKDYWGNRIPSRSEVKRGTKGSIQYANDCREGVGLGRLRSRDFDSGRAAREWEAEVEIDYFMSEDYEDED